MMAIRGWRFFGIVAGLSALMAPGVRADGPHILSSHGMEASARGLAFTAKADSFEAFYHNPAGLAQIKGHQIGLSLMYAHTEAAFDRADGIYLACPEPGEDGEPVECPPMEDRLVKSPEEAPHARVQRVSQSPPPLLGYVTDLNGAVPFTFGFGIISPNADGSRELGNGAPTRYSIQRNSLVQFNYEAGIGYTLPVWENRIQVGATFGGSYASQDQDLAVVVAFDPVASSQEDMANDAKAHFETLSAFAPSWSIGILVHATDSVDIGLSYRGTSENKTEGDGYFQAPEPLHSTALMGEPVRFDVELPVRLPSVLRAGIRYHQPRWDVEFDYIYTDWSYFGDIELTLSNVRGHPDAQAIIDGLAGGLTEGPLAINKDFKDTHAFALGGSCLVGDALTVRAGVNYQPRSSSKETIDPIFPDVASTALGTGIGYDLGMVDVSLAGMYLINEKLTVKNSGVKSLNLIHENQATFVGNGTHEVMAFQLLGGLTVNF